MRLPGLINKHIYYDMISQHGGSPGFSVYKRPGGYLGGNSLFTSMKSLGTNLANTVGADLKKNLYKMGLQVGKNVIFKRQPIKKALKGVLHKNSRRLIGKAAKSLQDTLDIALAPGSPQKKQPAQRRAPQRKRKRVVAKKGTKRQKGGGFRTQKLTLQPYNNLKKIRKIKKSVPVPNFVLT